MYEAGKAQLVLINADNTSQVQRVPDSEGFWPSAWSPDGKQLVGQREGDLWVYSAGATPPLQVWQKTPERESHPSFSPSGKWLAFTSNTNDRNEVYVAPYPGPGRPIQVSTSGGSAPSWSRDGRELFFTFRDGARDAMMALNMANPAQPGKPTRLFTAEAGLRLTCNPVNCYAVGSGARQFITTRDLAQPPRPVQQINLVVNWLDLIRK